MGLYYSIEGIKGGVRIEIGKDWRGQILYSL